jgi:hypothetical protein
MDTLFQSPERSGLAARTVAAPINAIQLSVCVLVFYLHGSTRGHCCPLSRAMSASRCSGVVRSSRIRSRVPSPSGIGLGYE